MSLQNEFKLTPVQRSLADSIGLAQRGDHDHSPDADAAVASMAAELKALRRKVNFLYLGTTLGAFLILAQPTSSGISVEALGVKLPLSVLSKQAIAVVLSGAFGYYAAGLVSFTLLYGTLAAIFARTAPEGWEYLACRYDADMLWTTLLTPKKLGYTAPVGEGLISGIVQFSNGAVVLSHVALVVGAILAAGIAALTAHNVFGIGLAALALLGAVGAIIGACSALFLKLRYGAPESAG